MPAYQIENWETLTWKREKDKRIYKIFLHQDLFGNWIVTRQWGGVAKSKRGKYHQVTLEQGQALVKELSKIRKYRKYRKYEINTQAN
jgi:hypothetical protein